MALCCATRNKGESAGWWPFSPREEHASVENGTSEAFTKEMAAARAKVLERENEALRTKLTTGEANGSSVTMTSSADIRNGMQSPNSTYGNGYCSRNLGQTMTSPTSPATPSETGTKRVSLADLGTLPGDEHKVVDSKPTRQSNGANARDDDAASYYEYEYRMYPPGSDARALLPRGCRA